MPIAKTEVEKIAHLARIAINASDIPSYARDLSNILKLVAKMADANTDNISPLAYRMDATQRLREDIVTEVDQHELLQQGAPKVVDGLYLVEKVIA